MGRPSKWLSTIPGGEGVRGETRVDESKMSLVISIYQIMVVLVNLDWSKLSLVHNILV